MINNDVHGDINDPVIWVLDDDATIRRARIDPADLLDYDEVYRLDLGYTDVLVYRHKEAVSNGY